MLPPFEPSGYLPDGLHLATDAEVTFRFGSSTARRRQLIGRVRRWIELARLTGCRRLLIDGSFVTDKPDPGDVDAATLLASDFDQQVGNRNAAAMELELAILTRSPAELFSAQDDQDWPRWVSFFGRRRNAIGLRKGLVELQL